MNIKNQISFRLRLIIKQFLKLFKPKIIIPINKFSPKNKGIIKRLENPTKLFSDQNEFIKNVISTLGIQVDFPLNLEGLVDGIKITQSKINFNKVIYDSAYFTSYDDVKIPIYKIYPPNFDETKRYPSIIIFSGHGSAHQVAFDATSYQNASGSVLSKHGFLVYVMENRGMGRMSYLGNHLRIDAVARLTGGSWYGEIITDALWLIENLHLESNVVPHRIFTAGVSTGGALSMISAALDKRIASAFVQGFLGSYKNTFGIRGSHCLCGHITGILKIGDMADIASLIAPRPVLFVNGTSDSFYYTDANSEFNKVLNYYKKFGVEKYARFIAPEGIGHIFSVDLAAKWFSEQFNKKL